jgi:hypothetical protein
VSHWPGNPGTSCLPHYQGARRGRCRKRPVWAVAGGWAILGSFPTMAAMAEQSRAALAWERRVALLWAAATRASEFADLLASVDPRWHAAIQVVNSDVELRILPAADSLSRGWCLRIRRSESGFPMELTRRESFTSSAVVARSRATAQNAAAALARMLGKMLEDREVTSSQAGAESWEQIVGSFRANAAEDAAKAGLAGSVDHAVRERCEVYDNGQVFGIIRAGDTSDDGEGIWISRAGDGWSFSHRTPTPPGGGTRVIREVAAGTQNAAQTLNGLLKAMASSMPAPGLSAQDAYSQLLRVHVTPALRHDGYKGSGGHFHRSAGEYQVALRFQKSRYSTRARVDYRINISVAHPATVELFSQANQEAHTLGRKWEMASAGAFSGALPGLARAGVPWMILRPGDDLEAHAAVLLAGIRNVAYPVIEEQLHLPLPLPTPPAQRAARPSQDALNRQMLEFLLPRLEAAGVEVIGIPDQPFEN